MKVTYKSEIGHCSISTRIREVTITNVRPAKNSDFLDTITFKEIAWNVISQRGTHEVGERVLFIPPESVLPFELSEELDITRILSKGKVRVAKLRGNRSEGLIVDLEKIEPYLPYIMKWEDPPSTKMRGQRLPSKGVSPDFERFYDMPNILNEPDLFTPGEKVCIGEKIHGVNSRTGFLKHPATEEYQLHVGSHNVALREKKGNLFWDTIRLEIADKLPEGILFFSEIFGSGVQKRFHYDRKHPDILIFAAMEKGVYFARPEFESICERNGLPYVKTDIVTFKSIEQIRELADMPSGLTKSHVREGIVITSFEHPEKMAKCVSFKYLTGKKSTERH